MLIYKDIISGDELFSDSYKIELIDDCYYEIEGKFITEKDGDCDEDDVQGSEKTDINIVIAHKLQPTDFDKKQFVPYIKDYLKKLIAKVEENDADRVSILKWKLQAKLKDILSNFGSYKFYTGETKNPDACTLLLNCREDYITPFFTVFKDSVES